MKFIKLWKRELLLKNIRSDAARMLVLNFLTVNLNILGSFSQLFADVHEARVALSGSIIYGRVWVKRIFKSEFTPWLQERNTC